MARGARTRTHARTRSGSAMITLSGRVRYSSEVRTPTRTSARSRRRRSSSATTTRGTMSTCESGFSRPEVEKSMNARDANIRPAAIQACTGVAAPRSTSQKAMIDCNAGDKRGVVHVANDAVERGEHQQPQRMRERLHALGDVECEPVAVCNVEHRPQRNQGIVRKPRCANDEHQKRRRRKGAHTARKDRTHVAR